MNLYAQDILDREEETLNGSSVKPLTTPNLPLWCDVSTVTCDVSTHAAV